MSKVDWFLKAIRISSAWNPVAAIFLQLQAEFDGIEINRRLDRLEDPISSNCENAKELCGVIYDYLKGNHEALNEDAFVRFSRPLTLFESEGYLKRQMKMGSSYAHGLESIDPIFVLYLARLFESQAHMSELFSRVDECNIGVWIDGIQLAEALDLPEAVVRSVFALYVKKGYGIMSAEIGTCNYRGVA
ncbi:hypothetical protein VXM60_05800 [Shewanella khirikhana]|uniref:hypothetical protein n=1 Tax=Shewanella khirikhana TaxID=1965282 RepID=UPI0030CF6999